MRSLYFLVVGLLLSSHLCSQTQLCPAPPPLEAAAGYNIFSTQQETDLGDAIAEQKAEYHPVNDAQLNAYLQSVGDRLLVHIPVPQGLRIRFMLVDLPYANAFTLPGGRIYFTRKLVVSLKNEHELAAVLGHELGHALAREPAEDMSAVFRQVLGVTQVGDRNDVFSKWHQFQETVRIKSPKFNLKHSEREQLIADQVALYALANAGYSPQAFVDFWDRFAQTGGKTGGLLSDLFGTTKPEERRLREARRNLSLMPAACLAHTAGPASEAFLAWQAGVTRYAGVYVEESLPGLIWKRVLHPPLQADYKQLRFSPDGRYLLAQDDSTIYVLSREPLSWLFSIDAPDADFAGFTPDSQAIVFANENLHVEHWEIATRRRIFARELVVHTPCRQTLLSPDGKTLACVSPNFDLQLLDAASGNILFDKKAVYSPTPYEALGAYLSLLMGSPFRMGLTLGFSPDSHYLVAARNQTSLALDVTSRTPVSLPGHVRSLLGRDFVFLAPDRLAGINPERPQRSAVVSFPDGKQIAEITLGRTAIARVTRGDYIILRPIKDYPVGVMDWKANKIFMASKEPALDVYDKVYARGRLDGAIILASLETHNPLAAVTLPPGHLGRIRAESLSPDARWLAVSGRSRAAVWNLESGERVFHVRNFNGAWFDDHDKLIADFPKNEQVESSVHTLGILDPVSLDATDGEKIEDDHTRQFGQFLVTTKAEKQKFPPRDSQLEVRDVRDGKLVWSTHFAQEEPRLYGSWRDDRIIFAWSAASKAAKQETESDPELKNQLASSKEKELDQLLQVHELHSGKPLGQVLVLTGKGAFKPTHIVAADKWVAVGDNHNRVLVFGLGDAQPRARLFGHRPIISSTGLLAMENEAGQVEIYDLTTLQKRTDLNFSSPVAISSFCDQGKKLMVLTANQTAYLLDVSSGAALSPKQQ